jgi:hypothetical protein
MGANNTKKLVSKGIVSQVGVAKIWFENWQRNGIT